KGNRHFALTHANKSTYADYNVSGFIVLIQDHVVDVSDLVIVFVVNRFTKQLFPDAFHIGHVVAGRSGAHGTTSAPGSCGCTARCCASACAGHAAAGSTAAGPTH